MTARATVLGRRPDGVLRRYGVDPATRTVHLIATRTGRLAYCGVTPQVDIKPTTLAQAQRIERLLDAAVRSFSVCRACTEGAHPAPDPRIWKP